MKIDNIVKWTCLRRRNSAKPWARHMLHIIRAMRVACSRHNVNKKNP